MSEPPDQSDLDKADPNEVDQGHADHTYDLVDETQATPPLPGTVSVAPDVDRLLDRAAADLVVHACNCVRTFGDFHLAVSSGEVQHRLCERLMYDPGCRILPWRRTHLWLADEACVPFDHPASCFGAIREIIVEHSDIPREQVHPIPVDSPAADTEYESHLREALAWREKGQDRLDYVLLGMGADGHVAGLWPHTQTLEERSRFVMFNTCADAEPPDRVTMTFSLINASRYIGIMAAGLAKAEAVRRMAVGDESMLELPAMGIQPLSGGLAWYLDVESCSATELSGS